MRHWAPRARDSQSTRHTARFSAWSALRFPRRHTPAKGANIANNGIHRVERCQPQIVTVGWPQNQCERRHTYATATPVSRRRAKSNIFRAGSAAIETPRRAPQSIATPDTEDVTVQLPTVRIDHRRQRREPARVRSGPRCAASLGRAHHGQQSQNPQPGSESAAVHHKPAITRSSDDVGDFRLRRAATTQLRARVGKQGADALPRTLAALVAAINAKATQVLPRASQEPGEKQSPADKPIARPAATGSPHQR